MALVGAGEDVGVKRAVGPAGGRDAPVPVSPDGDAGHPGEDGIGEAPEADEDVEADAEVAEEARLVEDAEVLEQQRDLDEGGRHLVEGVGDVERLFPSFRC